MITKQTNFRATPHFSVRTSPVEVDWPLMRFQKQVSDMTPEEIRHMRARVTQKIQEMQAAKAAVPEKKSLIVSINLGECEGTI